MDITWRGLAHEGALAAEHIAIGVTAVGRANYARTAYYAQAFFALSTGIERSAKLAQMMDQALDQGGEFPDTRAIRAYSHELAKLLHRVNEIAVRRGYEHRLPSSHIHVGIIDTLSAFASNVTRYYNLEVLAGDPTVTSKEGPEAAWYRRVTLPILAVHYKTQHQQRHERLARQVDTALSGASYIWFLAESGEPLVSAYDASLRTATTEFSKPWERMYILQIARFLTLVLLDLSWALQRLRRETLPALGEFFGMYLNDDRFFRGRKTWSIYPQG